MSPRTVEAGEKGAEGNGAVGPGPGPHGGRWLIWLPLLLAASVLYMLNFSTDLHGRVSSHVQSLSAFKAEEEEDERAGASAFLVDSSSCRIPALAPWDPLVASLARGGSEKVNCSAHRPRPLVASDDDGHLRLRLDALPDYNVSDASRLRCCYTPLHRPQWTTDKHPPRPDDIIQFANYCIPIEGEASAAGREFVRVDCFVDGERVFRDFHAFVPRRADVEKRCRNASEHWPEPADEMPSVLLLGLDAVSRLNFHRQMPLSLDLLNQLGAIEMLGFNKIGDNTFPNLVAALSGLTEAELRTTCWPKDDTVFDKCPWVWRRFVEAGFRTVFGEDATWMAAFHYLKRGFALQPTDYYLRPLAKSAEDEIGHTKPGNAKICIGTRLTLEMVLEYVRRFAVSMRGVRSFGLFWTASLTHDFVSFPRFGDEPLRKLLEALRDTKVLNESIVVLLSDHGMRWGSIRHTYQGRLEERLPLMFFLFPPWFRERYPSAVAAVGRNARRLTTPFDLHATLLDLLRPRLRLDQAALRRRSAALTNATRSVSLFLQVPKERTCEEAGITPHWCTCQDSHPIPTDSDIVNRTANFLVHHVNGLVSAYVQCALLSLAEIRDARQHAPPDALHTGNNTAVLDYVLVVRTLPGGAVFEATVRHRPKEDSLSVAGGVSRLNTYGSQSACVANFHAKLYCFCSS